MTTVTLCLSQIQAQQKGLLSWCTYVLKGLKDEIEKIDRLLDYDFLRTKDPGTRDSILTGAATNY